MNVATPYLTTAQVALLAGTYVRHVERAIHQGAIEATKGDGPTPLRNRGHARKQIWHVNVLSGRAWARGVRG